MPDYNSPLGNKKFNAPALRELDIPDAGEVTHNYGNQPTTHNYGAPQYNNSNPPLGNNPYARGSAQQMQQSAVEDTMAFEQEIKQAREVKRTGKERLNDGAKQRIEMLIGLTKSVREVTLGDHVYVLQTLRSKEMREAIMLAAEFDGTVQSPFEIRRQLLARSLIKIAGVEIAQFVGSDSLEARLALIDELDHYLSNTLFDEYNVMTNEAKSKFDIKTNQDAAQVIDDLKK